MLQHTNFGIVIDEKTGYKIDFVVVGEYGLRDGEKIIKKDWNIANTMLKPKWTGIEWIEGATEEEIKEWEEKNKLKPKEPSEDEILISNVLLENATLKQKTNDLEEMTANLMLKIAELKGGNTNV
ncbi:hypothetical protein FC789_02255 [Clostridium botulinum]|nr:hypothetical protein [Clostridium botulinum]NFG40024.1 hypothetical protein [Clostridium botulinum]